MSTLQFVSEVSSAPTVRLDLNNRIPFSIGSFEIGYPEVKHALVENGLQDGGYVAASSFGPRRLRLDLNVVPGPAGTADSHTSSRQALYRELNRPDNWLMWQVGSKPVFFRTFRAAPGAIRWFKDGYKNSQVSVELLADSFAVGLKETISGLQVTNDPAATNKPWVDLTAGQVIGDVETPAIIKVTAGTAVNGHATATAVRRRGTPSNGTFFIQCESLTQGTDTTTQAFDAAMSGSSNNFSRCTFGTNANLVDRLSGNFPSTGTQSVDMRGRYNVWLACRCASASANTYTVRLGWGQTSAVYAGSVARTISTASASKRLINLGEISFPIGSDPVYDGYGAQLQSEQIFIRLQASRESGVNSLDFDTLIFVPSDEETAFVKWSSDADRPVLDGVNDTVWSHTAGVVQTGAPNEFVGGDVPMLTPNQVNRLFFLTKVEDSVSTLTDGVTFDVSYYPRYLELRPAAT